MSVIFYKYFITFLKPCNARYLHPTRSSCFWFVLMHCKCYKAFEVHAIEQFVSVDFFLSTLDLPTLSYCIHRTVLNILYCVIIIPVMCNMKWLNKSSYSLRRSQLKHWIINTNCQFKKYMQKIATNTWRID